MLGTPQNVGADISKSIGAKKNWIADLKSASQKEPISIIITFSAPIIKKLAFGNHSAGRGLCIKIETFIKSLILVRSKPGFRLNAWFSEMYLTGPQHAPV